MQKLTLVVIVGGRFFELRFTHTFIQVNMSENSDLYRAHVVCLHHFYLS